MRHDCFVGIDLGSTTTKAVILDTDGAVLGRGITNSRSNYDIACAVARTEAFINARFGLLEQRLGRADTQLEQQRVIDRLSADFRREQYVNQLGDFMEQVRQAATLGVYTRFGTTLGDVLETLFVDLQEGLDGVFSPGSRQASHFFRDIVGSRYSKAAEKRADPKAVPFDVLMSLYDKCILKTENHALDLSFGACIGQALERTVAALTEEVGGLEPAQESLLRKAVAGTASDEVVERNTVGTGYGRARLPFPKPQIRSEILCHGLGAHIMFPRTATVLDIGGQDTKAIQVDGSGIVTSFQMNDRCAAGCGRYLGYIADEMNLGLHELGPMAQKSCHSVKINSTCTVFAGAELRDRLSVGQKREDILAGLHRAIILRAMSLLARSGGINNEFTFTGGVANNVAAVAALQTLVRENYTEDITMNISPESIYTGALGAATFARRDGDGVALEPAGTAGRAS